ncbi:fumarate reductase/succinate dehydrogenase flavoprotein domain protein [Fomes fomentarius]|nr:fumarate reductase/succinate dehydrogenase flavoprotein domain protein [Fomes fomentarius]
MHTARDNQSVMTSSDSTTPRPRIAIIGGGPAGLVLLLTLHRRGVPATLYERESGFDSRAHLGGILDLGYDSGQRALRENGLEDAFKRHSRAEADEFKICDKSGKVLLSKPVEPEDERNPLDARPEIDRSVLRKMLLDAAPNGAVKWGHALSSVRPLGNGQHELTFANGFTVVSDILIGADGAFSHVRPLVSPTTPIYYGLCGTEISLSPEVAARPEMQDVREAVGEGSIYAPQELKAFIAQKNGDGRIRAYAWHSSPIEWMTPGEPDEARKVVLEIFKDWAPWMRKLIENCDDAAVYHRSLFYLPVGHRWDHVPGVTLVGDAAHLMGPFAGAGANLAMVDGLELGLLLAKAIAEGKSGDEERETAVAAWEEKMFASAGRVAAITMENFKVFIHPNAPESAMERVRSFMMRPSGRREA